jgi:hypothetical protein
MKRPSSAPSINPSSNKQPESESSLLLLSRCLVYILRLCDNIDSAGKQKTITTASPSQQTGIHAATPHTGDGKKMLESNDPHSIRRSSFPWFYPPEPVPVSPQGHKRDSKSCTEIPCTPVLQQPRFCFLRIATFQETTLSVVVQEAEYFHLTPPTERCQQGLV